MSGFLLNGVWGGTQRLGPGLLQRRVRSCRDGRWHLVIVSRDHHADLLWAIRGAGPGFFGVVTEYTLKLYSVPRAILTSTYYYPLSRMEEVGAWAADIARQLPRAVELALFCAQAPPASLRRAVPVRQRLYLYPDRDSVSRYPK
ncbi:MAG: hypothetical protein R3B95_06515 [Nitrospirales bacterium]|nr:hypothetical protein [Nitrospirales bacterium]